jgi:hypothetical protein
MSDPDAPVIEFDPHAMAASYYEEPGVWLLSPLPLAIICFSIAALAARVFRRRFEWVGAGAGLTMGIALVAILEDETERLLDNVIAHWPWLVAVTLSGIAGGVAARIAGLDIPASREGWRTKLSMAARTVGAVLLGIATMLPATLAFVASLDSTLGAVVGWLLFLAMLASIAAGGWIIGKFAPRFPIACAIFAVVAPPSIMQVVIDGLPRDFDLAAGILALLCVPAAVAAYVASSRSPQARAQREAEADGFFGDVLRASGFALVGTAFLTGFLTMTQDACVMHDQMLSHRIEEMGRMESPADALAGFKSIGVRAQLVHRGPASYRVEIADPPSVCNRFSGGKITAQYPAAD